MPRLTRTDTFEHTIAGLLTKRQRLMDAALRLREQMAEVSNDIDAIDRTLKTLGYDGDLKCMSPRGHRVVYFHRNELRRFVLGELRQNSGTGITSRELAERIVVSEGKDARDRKLMSDMVRRVGKALKLLRHQRIADSRKGTGGLVWSCQNPLVSQGNGTGFDTRRPHARRNQP